MNLAEQQLVDCVKSPRTSTTGAAYASGGCGGGWSQEAMDYARKYNVTFEPNYAYTASNGVCKQKASTPTGGVATALKQDVPDPGYYVVPPANLTAWKNAIQYTPAVFYFRVESPFQFYSGKYFSFLLMSFIFLQFRPPRSWPLLRFFYYVSFISSFHATGRLQT